jgi:hypothetical protein
MNLNQGNLGIFLLEYCGYSSNYKKSLQPKVYYQHGHSTSCWYMGPSRGKVQASLGSCGALTSNHIRNIYQRSHSMLDCLNSPWNTRATKLQKLLVMH